MAYMDHATAQLILANFLERLVYDEHIQRYRLEGVVGTKEVEALEYFTGVSANADTVDVEQDTAPHRVPANARYRQVTLVLNSLDAQPDEFNYMCLDFGTALSKACATSGDDRDIVDLPLGRLAQDPNGVYPVTSSVFITEDRIWFGPQAVNKSVSLNDPSRKRIDSPKQEMSQGNFSGLFEERLTDDYNPSGQPFSKADVILLFLGFLTFLVGKSLEEKGHNKYVLRRFARPSWSQDRAEWANEALENMLAQAQILADTFGDEWLEGLHPMDAYQAVKQVKACNKIPSQLIWEPVLEAAAAANSALRRGSPYRSVYAVIDVGAGTSDFGIFYCVEPKGGSLRIAEIKGGHVVVRQAGDRIDKLVMDNILEKERISETDQEYQRLRYSLERDRRVLKENLFNMSYIEHTLENESTVRLTLSEFLQDERVRNFEQLLKKKFRDALNCLGSDWYNMVQGRIKIVFTGGGSELPMVRNLAEDILTDVGTWRCEVVDGAPEWLSTVSPELSDVFPQIAVALGGAQEEVPDLKRAISEPPTARRGEWTLPASYKGA